MKDTYRVLFDRYLSEVRLYATTSTYMCVTMCNMWKEQLNGMVNLLLESKTITQAEWGAERERIKDVFDTRKICGTYQVSGEIYKCPK